MNTKLALMYRDGENYKSYLTEIIRGAITPEQLKAISDCLGDGIFIIAEQVGLPTPSFELMGNDSWPNESFDHVFTTLLAFEDALDDGKDYPDASSMHTYAPATLDMDVAEFTAKVCAAPSWQVSEEWTRMVLAAERALSGSKPGVDGPSVNRVK